MDASSAAEKPSNRKEPTVSWKWPFDRTSDTHGGYYLYAVVTVLDGRMDVYKTRIRSDKVMHLARSVWKNN